jgi:hypothetical protein
MEYGETQMSVDWLESKIQNYLATYGSISPKMISIFAEQAKVIHKKELLNFDSLLDRHQINAYKNNTAYLSREEFYDETFRGNK